MAALPIDVGRAGRTPLAGQIYQAIRRAIETGRLGSGARLPSWRDLAVQLGVSRGTVRVAYQRLIDEQFAIGFGTAGTRDERVTPYSIRHGLARELRKRRVPTEQISLFLGHLPDGSAATTSIYAPYEPGFLSEAVEAIESVMKEVRKHLKRTQIDRPDIDPADLAEPAPKRPRRGIGERKREEIRFLILSGIAHAEVVRMSGVSSGTVSAVRQELRAEIPLYRNTENTICVPFACRGALDEEGSDSQAVEKNGIRGR
jgi:hypothetical protein